MGVWGTDRQDCSSQHLLADPYSLQVPFPRGVCLGLSCSRDFFFLFFDLFLCFVFWWIFEFVWECSHWLGLSILGFFCLQGQGKEEQKLE